MSPAGPEDKAREEIDRLLEAAGWHVCDYGDHYISKPCAIREFPPKQGHGPAVPSLSTSPPACPPYWASPPNQMRPSAPKATTSGSHKFISAKPVNDYIVAYALP